MVPLLLAVALAFSPSDARLAHKTAEQLVTTCAERDAGTSGGKAAANFILDAASATGADVRLDRFTAKTPRGLRNFTNLRAEFRVEPDAPWIVVVSHYDTKPGAGCPGANDGASTSGLLVALSGILRATRPSRANVMLLWLDGEECMESYGEDDGFWGSRRAAQQLKESGAKVMAVICIDMLGDRDLGISIPKNGSPALAKIALLAAKKAGAADKVALSDILVKDDHVPFIEAGFKAIDLIDFEYGSAPGLNDYWHTRNDTPDKISEASLLTSGRILAEMINILLLRPIL